MRVWKKEKIIRFVIALKPMIVAKKKKKIKANIEDRKERKMSIENIKNSQF